MSDSVEALIRDLSDPSVYPHRPSNVTLVQTHISLVFIAGDMVYKVKKPLNLGFLDFTTLEKRKHYCNQEVVLNSRFSSGIYMGVASIHEGPSGLNFAGQGKEVDAAVVMRRIPEDRFMNSMLEADLITPEILDRLADRLAYFHSNAATDPDIAAFGAIDVVYGNVKENFNQTVPYIGRAIDRATHEEMSALATDFLYLHDNLFRERVRGGFVRDCHGDLHVDHVVILDEIMLYDCIEFNDRFRYGDTAADLGFLLMDLDFEGFPAFAKRIAERYSTASGDKDILRLLRFYQSYRAFVRGKVLAITLDEPEISESEKARNRASAMDHFRLSHAYLKPPPPPVLIVMSGLMGTGKSFVAEKLSRRLGLEPLRSDVIRKEIHGIDIYEHQLDKYGRGLYRPNATERTYGALLEAAHQALDRGESVILDASFMRYRYRIAAREVARKHKARFRLIQCTAPDHVIHRRLEERSRHQTEPSDARWEIFYEQKTQFEPIGQDECEGLHIWDAANELNPFLASFVRELISS